MSDIIEEPVLGQRVHLAGGGCGVMKSWIRETTSVSLFCELTQSYRNARSLSSSSEKQEQRNIYEIPQMSYLPCYHNCKCQEG
jgi:hypothetical protein